jgi:hypothetical protein
MRNMRQYIEKWKQLSNAFKITLILAIMVTITLLLYVSKTYSWFTRQKKVAILAPVDAPQELYISAGNSEDAAFINLSGIDVQDSINNPTTCKDYVFCVNGSADIDGYYIQLAHTTNIQFNYSIYKALQYDDEGDAEDAFNDGGLSLTGQNKPIATYTSKIDKVTVNNEETAKDYYYPKMAVLGGNYINLKTENGENLGMQPGDDANGMKSVHDQSYEKSDKTVYSEDNVQKNAEPLYWHSNVVLLYDSGETTANPLDKINDDEKEVGEFTRYYILHIDWADKGLKNNKETDMVYITVATKNSIDG